jgi:4'-phosphopantetheinyl transferase
VDVYWLEQTEADVPVQDDWLGASELISLGKLRFAQRRAAWRLGRWTAKRALAVYLHLNGGEYPTPARIEIRPALSGAPEVFVDHEPAAVVISLSHREGRAICALAPPGAALGCDLESIESRSDAFLADYFTPEEQALVARQAAAERSGLVTLLWSAKESALKALRAGLRMDTRWVIVDRIDVPFDSCGWESLRVRYVAGHVFRGWWQARDNMVRTIVAAPAPSLPIHLHVAAGVRDIVPCNPGPADS